LPYRETRTLLGNQNTQKTYLFHNVLLAVEKHLPSR
jgi:hypothetical protein